jgi:hypothetical protein
VVKPVEAEEEKRLEFDKVLLLPCKLVVELEPERNMLNAADVVFAINLADGGSE